MTSGGHGSKPATDGKVHGATSLFAKRLRYIKAIMVMVDPAFQSAHYPAILRARGFDN